MKQQSLEFLLHSNIDPQNISCEHYSFSPGSIVDYSTFGRKQYIMHLMLEGKREYIFEGKHTVLDEYSVVFIPDGTNYVTVADDKVCHGPSLMFSLDDKISKSIPHGIYTVESCAKSELEKNFFALCELCKTMPTQQLRKKILALEILYSFVAMQASPNENSRLIAPALSYIAEHYKENLPISSYAAACNLSESYFRKRFTEITGISPIEYRNQLRFAEARRLCREGLSMKAIAEELGFCDENYLSRLYRRENGRSLSEDSRYI